MMDPSKYEQMIKYLAWGCLRRLPTGTMLLDDLVQEGWMVYVKLRRKRFKPDKKAQFRTILYISLVRRYQNIIRYAYKEKRHCPSWMIQSDGIDEIAQHNNYCEQEQYVFRMEVIEKIKMISPELADLLENGVPDGLLKLARHKARVCAANRRGKVKAIKFTKGLIEDFFGCNINKILEMVHSEKLGYNKLDHN